MKIIMDKNIHILLSTLYQKGLCDSFLEYSDEQSVCFVFSEH